MVQHIHICPVGFYPEPILAAVGGPLPMDKFFFLFNNHEKCLAALDTVEDSMRRIGQKDLNRIEIDPFDYNSIISVIMKIHHDECAEDPETKIYINFTSGTNIVAGACCSVSYFIGATLYYIMDQRENPNMKKSDLIRVIKTPRIPDLDKMKTFATDLLEKICTSGDGIELQELAAYMQASPQKINHHINSFVDSGLVKKEKIGRKVKIIATNQGIMFSSWNTESKI